MLLDSATMRRSVRTCLLLPALLLPTARLVGQEQAARAVDFDRDVRPVLSNHCFACHGPDEQHRQGDLRLDLRDEAMRVVAPGDVARSELVRRIRHADPDEQMPPPRHGKPLAPAQVSVLERWVAAGAAWSMTRPAWSSSPGHCAPGSRLREVRR